MNLFQPPVSKNSRFIVLAFCLLVGIQSLSIAQSLLVEPISVTVKDVKLEKVLSILSEKSGLKFISDPLVKDKRITLDLKEVQPMEALSIMTQLYDLGFQSLSKSGKYVVAPRNDLKIQTSIESVICEFANAKDLEKAMTPFLTPEVGKVFSDVRTNMLIIEETPYKMDDILELIKSLDQPTKQIYIKAAIAEISLTDDHERGIQWFGGIKEWKAATNFGRRSPTQFGDLPEEPTLPLFGSGLGVGVMGMGIDMALSMMSTKNDMNLLSTPHLVTLDNQTALIEVGDQIPFPKLNEFGVTSYEFKDATIALRIQPHINNDSTITIFLEPQANFHQGFTPDGIPIIAKRSASTNVVVANGKTLVLGGLMRETDIVVKTYVPILGAIPLLGELFKSTQTKKEKTELIVLLTPQIVDENFMILNSKKMEQFSNSNGSTPNE